MCRSLSALFPRVAHDAVAGCPAHGGVDSYGGRGGTIRLQALPPTVRVGQEGAFSGADAVEISAARGEVESFQVVVTAADGNLRDVSAQMSPLKGPAEASIPDKSVTLYREVFIPIRYSSPQATEPPGLIADPLGPVCEPVHGGAGAGAALARQGEGRGALRGGRLRPVAGAPSAAVGGCAGSEGRGAGGIRGHALGAGAERRARHNPGATDGLGLCLAGRPHAREPLRQLLVYGPVLQARREFREVPRAGRSVHGDDGGATGSIRRCRAGCCRRSRRTARLYSTSRRTGRSRNSSSATMSRISTFPGPRFGMS